jgi:hypothetical protein
MPHVLQPAMNLESLEINSDKLLQDEQCLDLTQIPTYPHLTMFSLNNVIWLEGTISRRGTVTAPGVEEFIMRHRKTLKKLRLHNCTIGISSVYRETPSCYWADVYNRLAEALTELVELDVEFRFNGYRTQYVQPLPSNDEYDPGYNFFDFNKVEHMERDASALKAFKTVVEKRKLAGALIGGDYGQDDK